MLPGWKQENILPELTRRAVSWVKKSAKSGKPFFLYLPLTSPHFPVVPAPEFKGKSKAGDYGDFVFQTDWTVGQVLDALQQAGVADNTLVIVTSDNGPEITGEVVPGVYDRITQFNHSSMGELRGAKRDTWEGGHRVPFIARWPGKIKAGSVSGHVGYFGDALATFAELAGVPAPKPNNSVSIVPELLGRSAQAKHDHLYWEFFEKGFNQAVLLGSRWKGIRLQTVSAPMRVFDLESDLAETKDVAAEQPAVAARIAEIMRTGRVDNAFWKAPKN
jgi:arylsulfatase A-like enzyme